MKLGQCTKVLREERFVIGLHCTKGILYPHCTTAHDPRVRTYLDNLIAYRLFSRENGPICDSNGGTTSGPTGWGGGVGPPAPVRDISTPWATPPFERDLSVLEAGGRDAVKRPVKLKNTEVISLFYKKYGPVG